MMDKSSIKKVRFNETVTVYHYEPLPDYQEEIEEPTIIEAIIACVCGFVFIGGLNYF